MNKYEEALDAVESFILSSEFSMDRRYAKESIPILRELVDKHKRLVDYLKENSVHYSNGHYTVRDEVWISEELMDGE